MTTSGDALKVGDRVQYTGDPRGRPGGKMGAVTSVTIGDVCVDWDDGTATSAFPRNLTRISKFDTAPATNGEALPAKVKVKVGDFVRYRGNFVRVVEVQTRTLVEMETAGGGYLCAGYCDIAHVDDFPDVA